MGKCNVVVILNKIFLMLNFSQHLSLFHKDAEINICNEIYQQCDLKKIPVHSLKNNGALTHIC